MQKNILNRYFRISLSLQGKGFPSLEKLATDCEVSVRTIKRSIQVMRDEFDAPIEYSPQYKGYHLLHDWSFQLPNLSEKELIQLLMVTSTVKQFHGTPLENTFQSIEKKLNAIFSDYITVPSEHYHTILSLNPNPVQIKKDIHNSFSILMKSITNQKTVWIHYYTMSNHSESEREVDPYHLYNKDGIWYFCGYCHTRQEVRDFALDRILKIKMLCKSFKKLEDFNPQDYCKSSLHIRKGGSCQCTIWFDPIAAPYIRERKWHCSQTIQEQTDKSIILELNANQQEIKEWVLQHSYHAKVLQPLSLQKEIQSEITKMMNLYKKNHPGT
ncbi:MAG: WYL domain-containing protein [Caldisericia bacterium]|nr:WYL domain-containing protein [Caldisericia bacterium]